MGQHGYLQQKKGNYYFRRRVPKELVELVGRIEWYKALGTSDREVARLAAKALEAETDEEMKRAYRALSGQPLSVSDISAAATKVSRRAEAYLRQFADGIDGSDQAFRKRHGTLDGASAGQTDLTALLKQIENAPAKPDPDWEREKARTHLADLLECLDANDYRLVEPFADEAFREAGLARIITTPENDNAPHEGQIELLDINRERSDYRALARTIMLREIKALKRHLRDITDAELGQLASAGDAPASLSPAPVIPISADLAPDSSKRPSQLLDRFRHDSRERRGESALTSFATVIGYLEQVTEDKAIAAITRNDVVEWYALVSHCPQKYRTRLKVETMREAIRKNETAKIPVNTPATVQKYVSHLRTFFDWARRLNLVPANPVADLTVERKSKSRATPSKTLSPDMLKAIFSSDLYAAPANRQTYRFWVPLLALFTGARMGEICGLERSQVKIDGEREWIDIHSSKTGKQYPVPIHPELERIGFVAFVKKAKGGKLFPDAPVGAEGRNAYAPVSQWFGRFLRGLELKRPGLNMHAFRHTFITAGRNSGIPRDMMMAFVGHSGGSVHDGYGDAVGITIRTEAMNKLRFDGLDLSHLHLK